MNSCSESFGLPRVARKKQRGGYAYIHDPKPKTTHGKQSKPHLHSTFHVVHMLHVNTSNTTLDVQTHHHVQLP